MPNIFCHRLHNATNLKMVLGIILCFTRRVPQRGDSVPTLWWKLIMLASWNLSFHHGKEWLSGDCQVDRSFPRLRQCLSDSLFTTKMESVFLPALGHLPIILTAFPLSKRLCHFKNWSLPYCGWISNFRYIRISLVTNLKGNLRHIREDVCFQKGH